MSDVAREDAPKSVRRVVALSGGIGGAKLALGLKRVLPPGALTVIANTGDDFEHMGLYVSPDIDTLVYTLSGLSNETLGWGRRDETWTFMEALAALGGETWFRLGDGDLAMHILRTTRMARGDTLTAITADVCRKLDVGATILPATDQPVRTQVKSDEGWLDFQDYFVARQAEPVVRELAYAGAETARPADGVCEILSASDVDAIVVCPSNPLISVEPILAVPGIRDAIRAAKAPVVAVSPIVRGMALKGPTAKMLTELGFEATARTVLERYAGLIDAFIADPEDIAGLAGVAPDVLVAGGDIIMKSLEDRERVARSVLDVAAQVAAGGQAQTQTHTKTSKAS